MVRRKQAFTLIELLVVISIVSLLSSFVLGSLAQARAKARDLQRIRGLQEVQKALEMYALDHNGTYPESGLSGYQSDCWDFMTSCHLDGNRLQAINPYLTKRPVENSEAVYVTDLSVWVKGYWYRSDGSNYKFVSCGSIEDIDNVPAKMRFPGYPNPHPSNFAPCPTDKSAYVYSSDTANDLRLIPFGW